MFPRLRSSAWALAFVALLAAFFGFQGFARPGQAAPSPAPGVFGRLYDSPAISTGSGWDKFDILGLTVFRVEHDPVDKYWIFYGAYGFEGYYPQRGIGWAWACCPESTPAKYATNPIFDIGPGFTRSGLPFVRYRADLNPKQIEMWFTASRGNDYDQIFYSTYPQADKVAYKQSPDTWQAWQYPIPDEQPALGIRPNSWDSKGVRAPTVLFENGRYLMWYEAAETADEADRRDPTRQRTHIGLATSANGMAWNRENPGDLPVLTVGPAGSWEETRVGGPSVFREGALLRMYYHGCDALGLCRIGTAISTDGKVWTKSEANPVFGPGCSNCWDAGGVSRPSALLEPATGRHLLWYIGTSAARDRYQAGVAAAPKPTLQGPVVIGDQTVNGLGLPGARVVARESRTGAVIGDGRVDGSGAFSVGFSRPLALGDLVVVTVDDRFAGSAWFIQNGMFVPAAGARPS